MIPAEISWAYIAFCFAWAGGGFWPFDDAYLNRVLERKGWEFLWLFSMGIPALSLMIVSARELYLYRKGRCNSLLAIDLFAKWRSRLSVVLLFSWLYAVFTLHAVQKHPSALKMVAYGGVCFMFWAWLENKRVRRDVRKQTGTFAAPAAR